MSHKRLRGTDSSSFSNAKHTKKSPGASIISPAPTYEEASKPVFPAVWEEIPRLLFVEMQKDDPKSVGDALEALTLMMSENDPNSDHNVKEAVRLGAPAVTILAMRRFQYNEDLQGCGCSCLQMLAFPPSNRSKLAKCGAMEVVVSSLRVFPDSQFVHDGGCAALQNMLGQFKSDEALKRTADQFVYQLDGIGLVTDAMKKFPSEAELQANCCGLLWALAEGKKDFKKTIASTSAVGMAKENMLRHANHAGVQGAAGAFVKAMFPLL